MAGPSEGQFFNHDSSLNLTAEGEAPIVSIEVLTIDSSAGLG